MQINKIEVEMLEQLEADLIAFADQDTLLSTAECQMYVRRQVKVVAHIIEAINSRRNRN